MTSRSDYEPLHRALLAAFILGGFLGMVSGLYLASKWIEEEYRAQEAKKIGATMRHNQMCVKAWKKRLNA